MSAASEEVLCVGEVLWDALPAGLFLGGAPFNAACHLRALQETATLVSRVGDDRLGAEVRRRLPVHGLDEETIQVDPERPTGFVRVALDTAGDPAYDILAPAAWDAIAWTDALRRRTAEARALVFGTLAQRHQRSRRTIQRLAEAAATTYLDLNLRPPHVSRSVVASSLRVAHIAKMNRDELQRLRAWFDVPEGVEAGAEAVADAFGCRAVCVTRGAEGAWLWHDGRCTHHPGYSTAVRDTVGAGDAFGAALLAGFLAGRRGRDLLALANRLGAYVAAQAGATPDYAVETLDDVHHLTVP
jgi:fructokinase